MAKIKKGTTTVVPNENRKFGADTCYFIAHLDGAYLAFTEEEILKAQARAVKNPEDTKKVKLRCF